MCASPYGLIKVSFESTLSGNGVQWRFAECCLTQLYSTELALLCVFDQRFAPPALYLLCGRMIVFAYFTNLIA